MLCGCWNVYSEYISDIVLISRHPSSSKNEFTFEVYNLNNSPPYFRWTVASFSLLPSVLMNSSMHSLNISCADFVSCVALHLSIASLFTSSSETKYQMHGFRISSSCPTLDMYLSSGISQQYESATRSHHNSDPSVISIFMLFLVHPFKDPDN